MIKRAPVLHFTVPGKPATKGSVRAAVSKFGKPYVIQDCAGERTWRRAVALAARVAIGSYKMEGGISVTIVCHMQRPQRGNRAMPSVRPDIDKIARSALDALTGIVYEDDGQVTELKIKKRYGFPVETEFLIMEDA